MKRLRRTAIGLSFVVLLSLLGFSLLLRYAAPNPTHRWYSTALLDTTTTSTAERGLQGENLLAFDLGLETPTNERTNNAVCVCNSRYEGTTVPAQCGTCAVYTSEVSNYRIPDFVTDSYIAESKNRRDLSVSDSQTLAQISEMASAAQALNIPLYLFVRANSVVDRSYYDLSRSTGGDVVQYFLVDGYENRLVVEQAINQILIVMLVIGAGLLVWEFIAHNRPNNPSDNSIDTLQDAEDKVDETEAFMKRLERLSKQSKDNDEKKGK